LNVFILLIYQQFCMIFIQMRQTSSFSFGVIKDLIKINTTISFVNWYDVSQE
jgi:hypothetical protein